MNKSGIMYQSTSMEKIRDYSFLACTFLTLSTIPLAFVDIYYYYFIIVVLFPILLLKHRTIDRGLLVVVVYLFIIGISNVLLGNNETLQFLKIYIGILFAYWFYYLIIKDANFNLLHLLILYYRSAITMAYIGIIQFFSFLINFKPGYDFSWLGIRVIGVSQMAGKEFYPVHAILSEPAAFGILLSPAVYLALSSLNKSKISIGSKFNACTILISYILTQSSTAYVALFFAIVLVNFKKINFKKSLYIILIIPTLIVSLYSISDKFRERLDSSINLLTGKIVYDALNSASEVHGSSLILFNHFIIAQKNAKDHPLGTGLGSHHVAFFRYNSLQTYFTGFGPNAMILNLHDANSLLTRILSEIGYLGILMIFAFLIKYFIYKGPEHYILVNHASLLIIFSSLLRGGHYFVFGLPFFVFSYYYSYRFARVNQGRVNELQIPETFVN